jgi:hypothetical protein
MSRAHLNCKGPWDQLTRVRDEDSGPITIMWSSTPVIFIYRAVARNWIFGQSMDYKVDEGRLAKSLGNEICSRSLKLEELPFEH